MNSAKFTFAIATCFLVACSTTHRVYRADKTTNIEGVHYSLPRAVTAVEIPITKTVYIPGQYARFAEELLGVKASTKKEVTFKVGSPVLSTRTEADPDQVFVVATAGGAFEDRTLLMELTKAGVLTEGKSEVKSKVSDFVVETLKTAASIAGKVIAPGATKAVSLDIPEYEVRSLLKELNTRRRMILSVTDANTIIADLTRELGNARVSSVANRLQSQRQIAIPLKGDHFVTPLGIVSDINESIGELKDKALAKRLRKLITDPHIVIDVSGGLVNPPYVSRTITTASAKTDRFVFPRGTDLRGVAFGDALAISGSGPNKNTRTFVLSSKAPQAFVTELMVSPRLVETTTAESVKLVPPTRLGRRLIAALQPDDVVGIKTIRAAAIKTTVAGYDHISTPNSKTLIRLLETHLASWLVKPIVEWTEARREMITGKQQGLAEFTSTPLLKAIIKEQERVETELLQPFLGKKVTATWKARFDWLPESLDAQGKASETVEFFEWDAALGVLLADPNAPGKTVANLVNHAPPGFLVASLSGSRVKKKVFLDFTADTHSLIVGKLRNAGPKLDGTRAQGFYYRVPATAHATVKEDDRDIAVGELVIPQYGVVRALPRDTGSITGNAYDFKLYADTGGFKMLRVTSDALSPTTVTGIGTAVTTIQDAGAAARKARADERAAERAAQDEIAVLERKKKILELQHAIRELENPVPVSGVGQ